MEPEVPHIVDLPSTPGCPQSALVVHSQGRSDEQDVQQVQSISEIQEICRALLNSSNRLMEELENHLLPFLRDCSDELRDFYCKSIQCNIDDAVKIALNTVRQSASKEWFQRRQLRITSCNAYSLYTYGSGGRPIDWPAKISRVVWQKFAGNHATKYGQKYEANAIAAYKAQTGLNIFQLGLLCNPRVPWLGYSPDGIAQCSDGSFRLLEITCPLIGKKKKLSEMMTDLPFLGFTETGEFLKKKHLHYAQVQVGMFITNVLECDFAIYSQLENDVKILNITFDEEYVRDLIKKLGYVYFNIYLQFLFENRTKLELF